MTSPTPSTPLETLEKESHHFTRLHFSRMREYVRMNGFTIPRNVEPIPLTDDEYALAERQFEQLCDVAESLKEVISVTPEDLVVSFINKYFTDNPEECSALADAQLCAFQDQVEIGKAHTARNGSIEV